MDKILVHQIYSDVHDFISRGARSLKEYQVSHGSGSFINAGSVIIKERLRPSGNLFTENLVQHDPTKATTVNPTRFSGDTLGIVVVSGVARPIGSLVFDLKPGDDKPVDLRLSRLKRNNLVQFVRIGSFQV
jgi:hypothetical protein